MSIVRADRTRSRLDSLARAGLGWAEFAERALDELHAAVPFEAACMGIMDPATGLITGSIKVGLSEVDEVAFADHEYVRDRVNLFRDLTRRPGSVGVLSAETDGDPRRSSRFRELFEPDLGLSDELRSSLQLDGTAWGGLGIYRSGTGTGFSPAEADFVSRLIPFLALGLRSGLVVDHSFTGEGATTSGPAVLLIDADDQVRLRTPAAGRWLDELGGQPSGTLPPVVGAALAAARALRAGLADRVPTATTRTRSGRWLTVHAAPAADADQPGTVVVTFEPAGPPTVLPLVVQAWGLTGREREVTGQVLRGQSTAEIASTLFLSGYTVQDHLKTVFAKAGVSSRRELMAKVFFDHYAHRVGDPVGADGWFGAS